MTLARELDSPFLIGTAGSAGVAPHPRHTVEMIREIAVRRGLSFRLAVIPARC